MVIVFFSLFFIRLVILGVRGVFVLGVRVKVLRLIFIGFIGYMIIFGLVFVILFRFRL